MATAKKSHRDLVSGSGTVTAYNTEVKGARLVFSQVQHFFPGEQVAVGPSLPGGAERYTILHGFGTEWQAHQHAGAATSIAYAFNRTDPSTSRSRGLSAIVPSATYYLYVSPLDKDGNHDWYTYIDSVIPVKGLHPYTQDRWTGLAWESKIAARDADVGLVPDIDTRVNNLDSLGARLRRR